MVSRPGRRDLAARGSRPPVPGRVRVGRGDLGLNRLEIALEALLSEAGSSEEVGAALRAGEVYLPRLAGGASDELQLPLVATPEGGQVVAVFPSRARLEAATEPGTAFARVPFGSLLEQWPPDTGVVIDPGGELECVMSVEQIPGGPAMERIPAGTRVFVGEPADEPRRALDALVAVFSARDDVLVAYRAQVYVESDQVPHLAVGIVSRPGADIDDVLSAASSAAEAGDGDISFLMVDPQHPEEPVASFMVQETRPFYGAAG